MDGYAGVKKASDEGRAQMSLDVKTLQAALRKLLPEMAPSMAHVEDYLRALYLPPQELLVGHVRRLPTLPGTRLCRL